MFKALKKRFKKEWKVDVLIEGEKGARLVQRMEKFKKVNPDFDQYPVDLDLPQKHTFKKAIQIATEYARGGIYSMVYKDKKKPLSAERR